MSKFDAKWTRRGAYTLLNKLESYLAPNGYHVGMTGSVLLEGESSKDLDVLLYPHNTLNQLPPSTLHRVLRTASLVLLCDRQMVHKAWAAAGSYDAKIVEVWTYKNKRIDIFYLK